MQIQRTILLVVVTAKNTYAYHTDKAYFATGRKIMQELE